MASFYQVVSSWKSKIISTTLTACSKPGQSQHSSTTSSGPCNCYNEWFIFSHVWRRFISRHHSWSVMSYKITCNFQHHYRNSLPSLQFDSYVLSEALLSVHFTIQWRRHPIMFTSNLHHKTRQNHFSFSQEGHAFHVNLLPAPQKQIHIITHTLPVLYSTKTLSEAWTPTPAEENLYSTRITMFLVL